jgi:branched-subunit amino acid ABC-type transport system permease component
MSEAGFAAFMKPVAAQALVLALAILAIRLRPQGLFGKA